MSVDLNRQFLERVVVWPGSQNDPGWINLHCHMKNADPAKNGGKSWVVGWPFKTLNDFINRAKWVDTTDSFFDVWFCTSLQSDATTNRNGKPKAVRLHRNALKLKAIWIDCDVKVKPSTHPANEPWKHYETMQTAWGAISAFRKKVGLPQPSALINSGGGLHVYWISAVPLTPEEWRSYAEGLKQLLLAEGILCDTGLTTDDVRILRVPGTHNHKYSPPRPVQVLHLGNDYNFDAELSFLQKVIPASNVVQSGAVVGTLPDVVDKNFTALTPAAAFAGLTDGGSLQAGIAPTGPMLVDPKPIFKECGFMRHALVTGGVDYDNPLWNLSVLATAFMENGNVFAHEVSKGHATYSAPDTQALYDRKVADRHERGIGYPSCAAIAGSGCKSCPTCPHFSKGKSPLNLRPAAVTVTVKPRATQSPAATSLQLPDGYDVNSDNVICAVEDKVNPKTGDVTELWLPLFHSRISNPWVQKDPDIIHFQVSYDKGNTIWTSVKHDDWCGQGYEKKLAVAKIKYRPEHKGRLEGFFMSWLSKMHDAAMAQTAAPFGWFYEAGAIRGFAYGGFIHRDDGTSIQAGLTDRHTQKRFQPIGQIAPWHTAFGYLKMQKRPELETIVAASFAAPLMQMTGIVGALLSAWGTSGVGKTYALEVGTAVWGHPKESKEVTSTTWKSVEKRLASTVNLPVFWDEITNDVAQKNVLEVLMLTTGGVRGGRLNQNTDQREKGTWSTLLAINSNLCFKEYIAKMQATHTAGVNRVLEYQIVPPTSPVGQVSPSTASQALLELHQNFGNVGLEYAKLLGANHEAIQQRITAVLHDLEAKLQPNEEDRFWIGMIGSLIVGAELANSLGVGFDLPALETFLNDTFQMNRNGRVEANLAPTAHDYAENHLTAFLQDHLMSTIWCEGTQAGLGKVARVPYTRLFPNAPLPHGVQVRFDRVDQSLRLSRRAFRNWCQRQQPLPISELAVVQGLEKIFGLVKERKTLGIGTGLNSGQEPIYKISVVGHQDLLDMMNSQAPNQDLGASVGMTAAAVDTGITTPEG